MTLRILISLSLSLLAWQKAMAQLAPADDFFNSGAQLYISNNIPAALERVEMGRQNYPDDEKLKKLEELLKQQQNQQQQNQQQQQDQQNQQSKNDQQKNQQNQSQQQNQQKQNEQTKSDQQKQPEQEKQSQPDQEKQQEQPGQPLKPGEMTPEEAKKLLDAQKGNEQLLQLRPDGKPLDHQHPIKDW